MNHRWVIAALIVSCTTLQSQSGTYLGFDRNDYPGDANLKTLHQTFSYTGYWLNNPPGASSNSWAGHRAAVESAGFGFLVLFNGRLYAELKSVANATRLGQSDAQAAATAARREGFPRAIIIFLDQEQGGRMLPEQKAYIYAWVDGFTAAGFRAGIYSSAIPGKTTTTSSPPSTSASTPAAAPLSTGLSMTPAHPHLAAPFRNRRQALRRAASPSPKSGSSRSPRGARTSPRNARTTAPTETATLQARTRRKAIST